MTVVAVGRRGYLSRVMGNPTGVRAPSRPPPPPPGSPTASRPRDTWRWCASSTDHHGCTASSSNGRCMTSSTPPGRWTSRDCARRWVTTPPRPLTPPHPTLPLTHGSLVTVEPGGQVEISTPPHAALDTVIEHTRADSAQLVDLLARPGPRPSAATGSTRTALPGASSPPRATPRWSRPTSRSARGGAQMMCSSASLQVCLDAGEADRHPLPLGRGARARPPADRAVRQLPPPRRRGHRAGPPPGCGRSSAPAHR